jgi:hypothetical protein
MVGTAVWHVRLYFESKKNGTPNVFSAVFYMFFWLINYLKAFSVVKTLMSTLTVNGSLIEISLFDQITNYATDFLLLVITILMLLRAFGGKVKNLAARGLNENNVIFIVFMFVVAYFTGQVIMVTGTGASDAWDPKQLSMLVNIMVFIVNLLFYLWYSNWVLQREGLTQKMNYTVPEIKHLMLGFLKQTEEVLPGNENVLRTTMNTYLQQEKVLLEGKTLTADDETLNRPKTLGDQLQESVEEEMTFLRPREQQPPTGAESVAVADSSRMVDSSEEPVESEDIVEAAEEAETVGELEVLEEAPEEPEEEAAEEPEVAEETPVESGDDAGDDESDEDAD